MAEIFATGAPRSPLSHAEGPSRLSIESFRLKLTHSFQQMMFVSGETAEPSVETTGIIEDIVRQQVIELVSLPPHELKPGSRLKGNS